MEAMTLYVLSHLELQNSHKELIFGEDGLERLNACVQELKSVRPFQKLFVWEPDSSDRKKDSHNQLMIILIIALLLVAANYFRLDRFHS